MKNRFSKNEQIEELFVSKVKSKSRKGKAAKEPKWEAQIEKLATWVRTNEGYEVTFEDSAEDQVDLDKVKIIISTRHIPEVAFYFFLHELGHVILIRDKKQYKHSYGVIFDSFSPNSLTLKVTTLQEELDAWREGLKIAKSLKLKVDRRKYEIVKSKAIATYLAWCSR